MPEDITELPKELQSLSTLYPKYNRSDLEAAHGQLMRHFENAWSMFMRLEQEGLLDNLNLTRLKVNPRVKPQRSPHTHPPKSNS
jgi:hypothetical protein